jgi:hypothetical protein
LFQPFLPQYQCFHFGFNPIWYLDHFIPYLSFLTRYYSSLFNLCQIFTPFSTYPTYGYMSYLNTSFRKMVI